jgi:hypothetical protein
MLAITRSCPPQLQQVSISIQASEARRANTRLRRCAQVRDRCRSPAAASPHSIYADAARGLHAASLRKSRLPESSRPKRP